MAGLDRTFDYLVPEAMAPAVRVGTMVRVSLSGRRVGGWVVGLADHPDTDRVLQPLAKVTGWGPPPDVIDLARWAAHRWYGRTSTLLRTASPPRAVLGLPVPVPSARAELARAGRAGSAGAITGGPSGADDAVDDPTTSEAMAEEAFAAAAAAAAAVGGGGDGEQGGFVVVRLPPAADPIDLVLAAARRTDPLILAPSLSAASLLAAQLRRHGHQAAMVPRDWARAAAGGCVAIGTRAAAWAPRPRLGAVLVLDEHDEVYQEERTPTWNARDLAIERARRAGVPCVVTSPCPSLESLTRASRVLVASRAGERAGWARLEVVDRRNEPPGLGLWSPRVVEAIRDVPPGERVVCVLNRTGRARLLSCSECGALARCSACGGAMGDDRTGAAGDTTPADQILGCSRCGNRRPRVCGSCGATKLKTLRVGVSRAREELELLCGRPVAEVTATTDGLGEGRAIGGSNVLVGTSAVLHRVAGARLVVFLDFDQELLAPRFRAGEQALALLARASRLVGGRAEPGAIIGGRVMVQTRLVDHEVIDAAVHADPSRLSAVEGARRVALGLPPERALAMVSGAGAEAFVAALPADHPLDVRGPSGGRWLLRADDHEILGEVLAATVRPRERVRVEVDPLSA